MASLGLIADQGPETATPYVLEICDAVLADHEEDHLVKQFTAGEPVTEGAIIGKRADGSAIVMPYDGAIIFAGLTAPVHSELCFLCKQSNRLEVKVSV